jgi:hypothetical protein
VIVLQTCGVFFAFIRNFFPKVVLSENYLAVSREFTLPKKANFRKTRANTCKFATNENSCVLFKKMFIFLHTMIKVF